MLCHCPIEQTEKCNFMSGHHQKIKFITGFDLKPTVLYFVLYITITPLVFKDIVQPKKRGV